ncbi:lysostaphin resistance A-like protein [Conyzicola sp.]|uniref:CPBP family intramembrane glutamic endopeptidase n=1 Tax=Conyzicola sp. TaxID=1969404 RepID=UPI00398A2027
MTTLETGGRPRNVWVALGVVAVYILFAAGLGNLVGALADEDDAVAQFALGHLIPLPLAIGFLLLFLRWSGWGADVWREQPTPTLTPRRWWLVFIPVLALLLPISQLGEVPWASRSAGFIALIALGTLMVGLGEELAIRGILLTAVRARHREIVALLTTAVVFGAAHIPGSLISGVPIAVIAVQFTALTAVGVTYYWVRRVTGRLWIGILLHAATDWVLYLGDDTPTVSIGNDHEMTGSSWFAATVQFLLWIAIALSVISVIREDRRNKKPATALQPAVG